MHIRTEDTIQGSHIDDKSTTSVDVLTPSNKGKIQSPRKAKGTT